MTTNNTPRLTTNAATSSVHTATQPRRTGPRRMLAAGAIATALIATGCGAIEEFADTGGIATSEADRVNDYIQWCVNQTMPALFDIASDYEAWTLPTNGPTLDEARNGLSAILHIEQCERVIEAGADSTEPVDVAAREFLTDLREMKELTDTAEVYYATRNYETDDLAEGRELHPRLIDAFDAARSSAEDFKNETEIISDALFADRLAEAESGDRDIYDMIQLTMAQGEKMLDVFVIDGMMITSEGRELADVDAFRSEVESLQTVVAEYEEVAADPDRELVMNFDRFDRQLAVYLADAELLLLRLERPEYASDEEWETFEWGQSVEGTFESLLDEWNELIAAYNVLG